MTGAPRVPPWLGAGVAVLARIALGALWIREGLTKYHAGFGRADIRLVVDSAHQNPRVPGVFSDLLAQTLGRAPGLFGVVVPAWETALGVALVLGIVSRTSACAAIGTLMTYWLSDQLIGQYPVMVLLAAGVLVLPTAPGVWRLARMATGHDTVTGRQADACEEPKRSNPAGLRRSARATCARTADARRWAR